jgi:hypothetical protein
LAAGTSGLEWSAEYYRAAEELEQGGSLSQTVSQSTINSARPAFSSSSRLRLSLCKAKRRICPSVSASKNSAPDSDFRDWFDDWGVGHQFEPNYLHHPVVGLKPSQAFSHLMRGNGGFHAPYASLHPSLLVETPNFTSLSPRVEIPFPPWGRRPVR